MIRWFAGHPTASNLLLVVILAMGIFAAPTLLRETFPDYSPTEASITIAYRGASATDVEDAICLRVTDALKSVNNLEELSCTAQDNVAVAIAKMVPGGNVGGFLDEVESEIGAITDFPEGTDAPVIRQLYTTDLVSALAINADMSFTDLETYANGLEQRLYEIDNVASVIIKGLSQRQWRIEVSRDLLQQYSLSVSDISGLIRLQNIDMPLGTIETDAQDIQLRFVNESCSLADLSNLVILSSADGGELKLGDIATIRESYDLEEEKILFNGERALILEVHKNKDSDAINVMSDVTAFLENERARMGDSVTLTITQDMTSIVADRLKMLVSNGIIGLILVAGAMSLFYRPRLAIWAILGLPVAFAGAFAVMALLGLSLNMITLVGLLIAIGIVMDDSVVITDSIAENMKEGVSPLDAVTRGVSQVFPGVMSSFLTTIAVFGPLSFLSGELGTVLEVMPIVLIAALAASLIEAFLVLPHHLKAPLAHAVKNKPGRFALAFDAGFNWLREGVGKTADAAIKIRYLVMGLLIVTLLGSVGYFAGGNIKLEAMPDMEGDVLEARLLMPQGTPLARTEDAVAQVVDAIERINDQLPQPVGRDLIQAVQVRYNENISAGESGPHVATVGIDLLTAESRATSLDTLIPLWQEEIGSIYGLINLSIQEPGFGPAGIPIEIRIQGTDLDRMKLASADLVAYLEGYVGVFNVLDDLRPGKPQRQLSLTEGAKALGFTSQSVASQLRSGTLGDIVDNLQLGNQSVEVTVSQTREERETLNNLDQAIVVSQTGNSVPLSVIADVKETRSWAKITLIDGVRTVTVQANVDAGKANAGALVSDVQKNWLPRFEKEYPDLKVEFLGQVAATAETAVSIVRGLAIGMFGVFLILSFQFRSYVEPLIVMIAIPMALIGSIWGHVIMGYDISMPSLIGAASLAGIVVNNSILLMQYINKYRLEGLSTAQAAGHASRARMRPIFISTATTIMGMLPLLAETSAQAASIIPLVISLVFGLLVSTILVLLALPALYTILDDIGATGFRALKSSLEEVSDEGTRAKVTG